MDDVLIGKGKLAGRGVYAARDFVKGEVVKFYHLKLLTQSDFDALPKQERWFVHSFWGKMYLFPEPSRYTNHSLKPNVRADLKRMCDVAIRDIKKGEMITINATHEIHSEVRTYIEAREKIDDIRDFTWIKGGYRNAVVCYSVHQVRKTLTLKRTEGNWKTIHEK